jgi:hypothetical protein
MGLTQFPNGIASFGMPVVGVGEETMTTGNVFFVDSGHTLASDGSEAKSPDTPAATIDGCIAKCTANNGDIIFVMPGHTEAPTSSHGINLDVAGVWVRGLGWGDDRPTITPENATVGIKLTAAACRVSNIIMALGTTTATVSVAIRVEAAGCIVENCEVKPHASSQYTNLVDVVDVADVVIRRNVLRCLFTGASSASGLNIDGADRLQIYENMITGFFSEHVIDNTSAGSVIECLNILIANNYLQQVGSGTDLVIEMDANATGLIIGNQGGGTIATADANFTPGNCRCIQNFLVGAGDDRSAILSPTALSS